MRLIIASIVAAASVTALHAASAYPELNVADGTIMTSDGSFSGRDFVLAKDFKMELLYNVPADQGQWVAITWDDKGRLLAVGFDTDVLNRVTIPEVGSSAPVSVQKLTGTQVGASEGLLYAFNGLYFDVDRSTTLRPGVYKLTDTNGDDIFDKTEVIRNFSGSGDHGTHNLRLSPDGKSIFMIEGNATRPTEFQASRVPKVWGEDTLSMRIQTGFMNSTFGDFTNEGYTNYFDPAGKTFTLFSMGNRNPVDFSFNKDGELFTYDSDMEWDMGDPWYRPTHVDHITSGADFGFRNGSRKHPRYYLDYAGPSVADVGSGSPVGVNFGTGTKFPARYQDAFYIADWSYGNLYAVMMHPTGSTYSGDVTPFISGRPFAVTEVLPNKKDGSLLVTTGGRAQTQLYRITYTGSESTAPTAPDTEFQRDRELRRSLEAFHGHQDSAAVNAAWAQLGSMDPRIRYAARIALEWQPQASWQQRALDERDPRKSVEAIVALARLNGKDIYVRTPTTPAPDRGLQAKMLASLDRIDFAGLPYTDKLDLLRAYSLTFIRLGDPDEATRQRMIAKFDGAFPSQQRELNWELGDMLSYLNAPSMPAKLMAQIRNAPTAAPYFGWKEWINPELRQRGSPGTTGPSGTSNFALAKQEDKIQYAQYLRIVTNGWTPELREEYMKSFLDLGAFRGGNEFASSNAIIRADAISQVPDAEKERLKDIIDAPVAAGGGRGAGAAAAAPANGAAAPANGAAAPAANGARAGRRGGGGGAAPAAPGAGQ